MPSNEEIRTALCAPRQFFEIETVEIRGVPTRTWKNAPRDLGAVLVQRGTNHFWRRRRGFPPDVDRHGRRPTLIDGETIQPIPAASFARCHSVRSVPKWAGL
jgi:hypothetical protein